MSRGDYFKVSERKLSGRTIVLKIMMHLLRIHRVLWILLN
jgi:hypothetical protein